MKSIALASFASFASSGCVLILAAAAACSSSSDAPATPASDSGSPADTGPAPDVALANPPTACNGHAELCARTYDQVAFPGTHDAYATVPGGYLAADQTYPMSKQLADGVRVLHLEVLPNAGDAYLCHSGCGIGKQLLADGLAEVKSFLDAHPDEVVSLLMESSNVATDLTIAAVQKAGLVPSLHVQAKGAPWPTLGEMIQSGQRVVLYLADLTKTGGATAPWIHDRFATTWETPWDNEKPSDFARCDADRGTKGNAIYVVDTYREDTPIASTNAARTVNTDPFLVDRLLSCKQKEGVLPNFVMVNFYEIGDVFHVVDVLNGLAPAPDDDLSAFPPTAWPGTAPADAGPSDAASD